MTAALVKSMSVFRRAVARRRAITHPPEPIASGAQAGRIGHPQCGVMGKNRHCEGAPWPTVPTGWQRGSHNHGST
jgi:hypothetical protein